MRAALAVIVAILIFLFCWMLIAVLLAFLGWIAVKTEQASSLFLLIHVLLIWILSPGVGAAIAIFSTSSIFRTVGPSTIFVGFVSVWAGLLLILAMSGVAS